MSSSTHVGNLAALNEMHEDDAKASEQHQKMMKRFAFMQFIIRRQIRCAEVFLFPFLSALALGAFFAYYVSCLKDGEWAPPVWFMVSLFSIISVVAVWSAAHGAKAVAVRTTLKLEAIPQADWFTVTGLEQNQSGYYPLKVSLRDPFGKISRLTVYGQIGEYKEAGDLYQMKCFIVDCLKSKWEPIAETMRKQKAWQEN